MPVRITREQWKELEPLLDTALDLPPAERNRFFQAMEDAGLIFREQLEWLAAECEKSDARLDQGVLERFPLLVENLGPAEAVAHALDVALAGRYRIDRMLGEGGMATVHLAWDLMHNRDVAIKVLRPELAAALGRERFLREIVMTAQLEHPYIVPLLHSGDAGGLLYYVMPYVRGETLRARLRREKQLPIADALAITGEIAEALQAAHERGIVHRDLKPENVLLADDHVRVADFGIARAVALAGDESLTPLGLAIGTPAYMSPEQAAGIADVDGRSDLYSLGCITYEMLAGEPPHTGHSPQALLRKRMTQPPTPVSVLRDGVPAPVEGALARALARTPTDRHVSALEFADALTARPSTVSCQVRQGRRALLAFLASVMAIALLAAVMLARSDRAAILALDANVIAVLPFRVSAADSAYNYFREGGVDLINAHLTGDGVPRAVDSRTILSRYRRAQTAEGRDLSSAQALELAKDAGAGLLFLGELIVTPSRLSASGRVLRVPGGAIVAEHTESGRIGDTDEIAIAERLLGRLVAAVTGEARPRLPQMSDSLSAVKAYLAGRQAHRQGQYRLAMEHYGQAIAIDSTFALAALFRAHAADWVAGPLRWEALRVLWTLRDRLSEADRAQALVLTGPNYPAKPTSLDNIRGAEQAARRNPDRPESLAGLGAVLLLRGEALAIDSWFPRAIAALDSAIALDSTFVDPVSDRLLAALIARDTAAIRRFASHYFSISPTGQMGDAYRWLVPRALNDTAAIRQTRSSLARYRRGPLGTAASLSIMLGLPLDDISDAITSRLAAPASREDRCDFLYWSMLVSAVRGQQDVAITSADSASRIPQCSDEWDWWLPIIVLGLAEPAYEAAAYAYFRDLASIAWTSEHPGALCHAELWRVTRGDTSRTREAVDRVTELAHTGGPLAAALLEHGLCARLLEALVESQSGLNSSPALARLEGLHSQGTDWEFPAASNLMLARLLEDRGDIPGALAAVRRRPFGWNIHFPLLVPASLRQEGRLAALAGDTAGAIRAYQHYLTIRDQPDPGRIQDEVQLVKAHLAQLLPGRS